MGFLKVGPRWFNLSMAGVSVSTGVTGLRFGVGAVNHNSLQIKDLKIMGKFLSFVMRKLACRVPQG